MVVLWGLPAEATIADVRRALAERDADVTFIDQRDVLSMSLELHIDAQIDGRIEVDGRSIDLQYVRSAYFRPYETARVPAVARAGEGSLEWEHAKAFDYGLWKWAETTSALVVNTPSAMASNSSKPYQAMIIRRLGFRVPETLITTDADAARDFVARHESVIYKSISSVRSIVSRVGRDQLERLEDVRWCPTQFQEFVPGTDYRVHVVGDQVFCCEIQSDASDYRYPRLTGTRTELRQSQLPGPCSAACQRLAQEFGLAVAGIDLRRTPDDTWYCFEVNGSPGFGYFDRDSGSIARAVADLLAAA
jgi:glutathione synthase/RimK-type ligase-like ATP-grasp enzyme